MGGGEEGKEKGRIGSGAVTDETNLVSVNANWDFWDFVCRETVFPLVTVSAPRRVCMDGYRRSNIRLIFRTGSHPTLRFSGL